MKPNLLTILPLTAFAALALAAESANAAIILYSTSFGGSSLTGLNGQSVDTSGATPAEHTLYGTVDGETWSADARYKADGSYTYTSTAPAIESQSGTLAFTPKDGYVYTLTMTTDLFVTTNNTIFNAVGYFETDDYKGPINSNVGSDVWMLTRPGDTVGANQVAHYNVNGGAGAQTALSAVDTTAPSTLTIVLNTTAGIGDWSADWYVDNTLFASKADLNAVTIGSVGIGNFLREATTSRFTNFELSVIPEPSAALLGGLGSLLLLRRRRD